MRVTIQFLTPYETREETESFLDDLHDEFTSRGLKPRLRHIGPQKIYFDPSPNSFWRSREARKAEEGRG